MHKSLMRMLIWHIAFWAAFAIKQQRPHKAQAKQTFCCGRKRLFTTDCLLTSHFA